MTAEFVVVLPAVLAVLVVALVAILLAAQRVTLTSAAFEISRLEARGDTAAAAMQLGRLAGGTTVARERDGLLHCVRLSARPGAGLLSTIEVSARGCAAVVEGGGAAGGRAEDGG